MNTFTEENAIVLGSNAVASGTAEVLTAVIDMADYDQLTFVVHQGTVAAGAVLTYTVKENSANSTVTPTPTAITGTIVTGTGATISNGALTITESGGNLTNKYLLLTVKRSSISKRWVFLSITSTVAAHAVSGITCIKSHARNLPVTQGATVQATLQAAS